MKRIKYAALAIFIAGGAFLTLSMHKAYTAGAELPPPPYPTEEAEGEIPPPPAPEVATTAATAEEAPPPPPPAEEPPAQKPVQRTPEAAKKVAAQPSLYDRFNIFIKNNKLATQDAKGISQLNKTPMFVILKFLTTTFNKGQKTKIVLSTEQQIDIITLYTKIAERFKISIPTQTIKYDYNNVIGMVTQLLSLINDRVVTIYLLKGIQNYLREFTGNTNRPMYDELSRIISSYTSGVSDNAALLVDKVLTGNDPY